MVIRTFRDKKPEMGLDVYVDDSAVIIGDVRIKDRASIWPCAVLRGDDDYVEIGRGSAMLDVSFAEAPRGRPVIVGDKVLVSHGARLHGCQVRDESLIGIGATVLDGAVIGERSVVAAGCLISPGSRIPPESFVIGIPGKVTRSTASADVNRTLEELRTLASKAAIYKSGI
ncbi:MAG TPA: gamma carbonic anhydrase family protein [Thermoplasmata archaeon]|jgi:carbonic anhydrase/acetyltransferase-like protein (isoleucine patch superfamily)